MKKIFYLIFIFFSCSKNIVITSWNLDNLNSENEKDLIFKSANLAKVISDMRFLNIPDILVLQEIDSKKSLMQFAKDIYLESSKKYFYSYISKEDSFLQIAILSKYEIMNVKSHRLYNEKLYANPIIEIDLNVKDQILKLIIVHFKLTDDYVKIDTREHRNKRYITFLKEILKDKQDDNLIILGDFNADIDELYIKENSYEDNFCENEYLNVSYSYSEKCLYYSPWQKSNFEGSYMYDKKYTRVDHFFLNLNINFKDFKVFNKDYIFYKKNKYYGPFYYKNEKGYSNHLPITIKISFKN